MLTLTISIPNNIRVYNRTRRMLTGDFSPICQDSDKNGIYTLCTDMTLQEVGEVQAHILNLEDNTFSMFITDSTRVQ